MRLAGCFLRSIFGAALLLSAARAGSAAVDPPSRTRLNSSVQRLQRSPLSIIGSNPREVEIGGYAQIRLSRPPFSSNIILTVGGIPVDATGSTDGLWWKFRVPTELPRGKALPIVVRDSIFPSQSFDGLVILPLRVLAVRPAQATVEAKVTLVLSGQHPRIGEARVWFDTLQAAVESSQADTVVVIVPAGLKVNAIPRILVVINTDEAVAQQPFRIMGATTWISDPFGVLSSSPLLLALLAATLILLAMVGFFLARQRWMMRAYSLESARSPDPKSAPAVHDGSPAAPPVAPREMDLGLPDLKIPDDLVEACVRGDCVLYAGAGLSARAKLPLWRPFITDLLDWSMAQGLVEPEFGRSLHTGLEQGDVDRVADSLVSQVREKKALEVLSDHIRKEFAGAESGNLSDVHRMLPQIGFGAALTTNFDHLLERAFGGSNRAVSVRLPREVEAIRGDLSQRRFFILKLYGDLDRSESLILSPAQYEEAIQGDRPFADVMQEIFLTRTILFLGCSLQGMDSYLRGLRFQAMSTPRHYAVIGVADQGWRVVADGLSRRYGIQVLPYAAGDDHVPLPQFVGQLQQMAASRSASRGAANAAEFGLGGSSVQAARRPLLRSLELKNIGPFEQIQLEFNSSWTILLGDNGVGKSTVLKALALAVAGEHAGALAGRLLKVGTTQGQITLRTTNDQTYVTEIFMNSLGQPEAKSIGARAFGGETLVLGFPPARAIAAGPAKAPQGAKGSPSPVPQDVLPILSGQPDPRILEIKQWIVNLDYLRARSAPDEAKAIQDLLDGYFQGMRTLLDIDIKSWRIADNEVFVTTVDGELPMDAMSQGTVSIFGWVGAVLQRLFDIQGRPGGTAIALVDEIDAHMHPEWQQAMVSRLKRAFPDVQFVVTTHSPFLAIGRTASEIIHILRERRTGKLLAESPTYDTTYMGVGNVLVSRLFGLQSKHDLDVQRDLLIRRRLSVKKALTEQERAELTRIEASLGNLNPAENIEDPVLKAFVEQFNMRTRALVTSEVPDAAEMQRQSQVANEIIDEILKEDESTGKQADAAGPPRQGGDGGEVKSS